MTNSKINQRLRFRPVALTIAGSDSGGGAGIQADLKTFGALDVHGTSAITCVTAQNPRGVIGIQAVTADIVRKQVDAVFAELRPVAVKTGMLYSTGIIRTVTQSLRQWRCPDLVVDPVMVATSGAVLLQPSAIRVLQRELFPMATLITPNLDEAQLLLETRLRTIEDLLDAAERLHREFGCAVLVKGGHLQLGKDAVDVLFDGRQLTVLRAARIRGVSTHGTGCTYSAAIAAHLALGESLLAAVTQSKQFISRAIARSYRAGNHSCLNPDKDASAAGA
jgi:hydroxymethylpyrimidine/phosphomethylpyrimidine kinase